MKLNAAGVTAEGSVSTGVRGVNASDNRLTVNSDSITIEQMWADVADELAAKRTALSPPEYQAFVPRRAAQLITDSIAEMLLFQTANLRLEDDMKKDIEKYADQELRRIVTEQHGGVQGTYERHLAERGQTLDDARQRLRRELIIAAYLEREVRPKVAEPTRGELLEFYETNKDLWRKDARRSMSLIELRVVDRLPADVDAPTREQIQTARAEAESTARAAWLELKNGASFADVARRYSDGTRAQDGGSWGWVNPESIRERYRPALDVLITLGAGQVSDLVESPDAFFIVRCDQLEGGTEPTFENVQHDLKQRHFQSAYNNEIRKVVEQLRRRATITPDDLEQFHAAVVAAAPQG